MYPKLAFGLPPPAAASQLLGLPGCTTMTDLHITGSFVEMGASYELQNCFVPQELR